MVNVDASQRAGGSPTTVGSALLRPRKLVVAVAVVALLLGGLAISRRMHGARPYTYTGTVEGKIVRVGSRFGGRVKEILVREGDRVTENQVLIVLEPGDLVAQKRQFEGELAERAATVQKLERGSRPQEVAQARARAATASAALKQIATGARAERIAAARARLNEAQVEQALRERELERSRRLHSVGALSDAVLEESEATYKRAFARYDAEQRALEELEHGSRPEEIAQAAARSDEARASLKLVEEGTRIEDIAAARGQLDAAQGRLDAILNRLEELVIKAPREARVESLNLRPGDLVTANAPAATLLESKELYVRTYVPETRLGHLKLGQGVRVTVDAMPGRSFAGMVAYISQVGEFTPRNLQTVDDRADQLFAARIDLKEGWEELRPGMAAFVPEQP